MIITTRAHVPDELGGAWLQHLRDFDTAHPGCHFEVVADAPEMSTGEIIKTLKDISPKFPVVLNIIRSK